MGCSASHAVAPSAPPASESNAEKIRILEAKILENKQRFIDCVKGGRVEEARAVSAHSTALRAQIRKLTGNSRSTRHLQFTMSPLFNDAAAGVSAAHTAPTTSAPRQIVVSPAEQDPNP